MQRANDCAERVPVIVIGTSRWSAPWLTEQNLAFSLAARHSVLYVEPPQISPRRRGEDGTVRLRRERVHGREFIVFRPVVLPLRSRGDSARASAPLYRTQLRALVDRLGFQGAFVLTGDSRPGIVGAARERLSSYIVKDWIYDDAELLGRKPGELLRERDEICASVDLVLAISSNLQSSLMAAGIRSELLRHGFHADLVGAYMRPAPREYHDLPAPRIVFAGRVDGRLDMGKLTAVARRFPDASVVMIGPVSPRLSGTSLATLMALPNVHILGARPREDLPPYLAHADCLLIPYRGSVWASHGSPLKLWDYLYAGPPIVGSGYSVLSDYTPLVRFADADDAFVEQVAEALHDDDGREERRAYAMANTWEERGLELEQIVRTAVARETPEPEPVA